MLLLPKRFLNRQFTRPLTVDAGTAETNTYGTTSPHVPCHCCVPCVFLMVRIFTQLSICHTAAYSGCVLVRTSAAYRYAVLGEIGRSHALSPVRLSLYVTTHWRQLCVAVQFWHSSCNTLLPSRVCFPFGHSNRSCGSGVCRGLYYSDPPSDKEFTCEVETS